MTSLDILDKVGSPDPDVRVLVIDDSLTIRQGLSRELQKLGLSGHGSMRMARQGLTLPRNSASTSS